MADLCQVETLAVFFVAPVFDINSGTERNQNQMLTAAGFDMLQIHPHTCVFYLTQGVWHEYGGGV